MTNENFTLGQPAALWAGRIYHGGFRRILAPTQTGSQAGHVDDCCDAASAADRSSLRNGIARMLLRNARVEVMQ